MFDDLVRTPDPPYVAVIFTSRPSADTAGYAETADEMGRQVAEQPGFLGAESARADIGITVSYWRTEADAQAWKQVAEHVAAQREGIHRWYADYSVRIATVTRDYRGSDMMGS